MDRQPSYQRALAEHSADVVFRKIKGRIVPIRRKANSRIDDKQPSQALINIGRSGTFGVGIGAGTYTIGNYAKFRIDRNIKGLRNKMFASKRGIAKKPIFDMPKPQKWTNDATPLANLSKRMFADQTAGYQEALSKHLKKLDDWHEAMRVTRNYKSQIKSLRGYSNTISRKIGPLSIKTGLVAGAASLAYYTGDMLYKRVKGKK